jgi:hypothetical protein
MSGHDKYDHVKESKKEIFFNNVIGGIAWGIGATVGAALILAIAGIILSKVNTIPIVGNYVENILLYISENQSTALDAVDKNK